MSKQSPGQVRCICRTGFIVVYHADALPHGAGWLSSGGFTDNARHAHEYPSLEAAERAAMVWGVSCYTIRTYSAAYWARYVDRNTQAWEVLTIYFSGNGDNCWSIDGDAQFFATKAAARNELREHMAQLRDAGMTGTAQDFRIVPTDHFVRPVWNLDAHGVASFNTEAEGVAAYGRPHDSLGVYSLDADGHLQHEGVIAE